MIEYYCILHSTPHIQLEIFAQQTFHKSVQTQWHLITSLLSAIAMHIKLNVLSSILNWKKLNWITELSFLTNNTFAQNNSSGRQEGEVCKWSTVYCHLCLEQCSTCWTGVSIEHFAWQPKVNSYIQILLVQNTLNHTTGFILVLEQLANSKKPKSSTSA